MHRFVFSSLAFAIYTSLYSPSESLNTTVITNATSAQKRPTKKGFSPLSPKVKQAFENVSLPKQKRTIPHREGLNFDHCDTDFDCKGLRYCYGYDKAGALGHCNATYISDCRCLSVDPICYDHNDCSPGEHCNREVFPNVYFCVSNDFLPDSDGQSNTVNKPGSQGVALDFCRKDTDCHEQHKCFMLDDKGWYASCDFSAGKDCFCDYNYETGWHGQCKSNSDCLPGEICPSFSFEADWCVSNTAYQGFNFDFCYSSHDCREPRSCYGMEADGSFVPCSSSDEMCVCMNENISHMLCSSLFECAYWAESCHEELKSGLSICIADSKLALLRATLMASAIKSNILGAEPSPETSLEDLAPESANDVEPVMGTNDDDLQTESGTPSPIASDSLNSPVLPPDASPLSARVCIAAHLLEHLESHELLYDTHRVARVLCDSSNSCATPGHIVQYEGKAMMMKNYCEVVGCTTDVMKVNSPRYQRGMQVPSMSKDLVFTAFAARYGTKTEERLLATAVRFGL